jgi:hypothetical protein
MRRIAALVLLLALALAPASVAGAASVAPPGNSGVDEYQESVPSADGNRPSKDHPDGGSGGGLTAAQKRKLDKLGPDGQAAAALADSTAPGAADSTGSGSGSGGSGTGGSGSGASGSSSGSGSGSGAASIDDDPRYAAPSVADAFSRAAAGSGGMGAALPALLVVTVLGGAAWLILRRRVL